MAIIRKRKIGKMNYYYLEHSFKSDGKVKVISKYLGKKKPENIQQLKKDIEFEALRNIWNNKLKAIQQGFLKEEKMLPPSAKKKLSENFMVEFIFNSSKIEGSKLTYKDTAGLFLHSTTPKNKPLNDVKEAEGYRKAFYNMMDFNGRLTLEKILEWHKMMLNDSQPDIAGRIRIHRIMVTGSRVCFPPPQNLSLLLKGFIKWCIVNKKKYNPVEFAALAHLKFVTIHPFTDGNGRISRLLANFVLKKESYPLFNIKFNERMQYYSNLETSQLWDDDKHFIRFFIKRYVNYNRRYLG